MNELYERISAMCAERGITVYRLCKETGIRASVLSDLHHGRKKGLSIATASKLADYFGVEISELMIGKKEAPSNSDEAVDLRRQMLIGHLMQMPEEEFALVDAFVQGLRARQTGE